MIWKKHPHLPEKGSSIIFKYKGCIEGNLFPLNVIDNKKLNYIEKWAYKDEYTYYLEKLRNKI